MSVRAASFVDTPAIAELYRSAYQKSRYAHCAFDPVAVKQFIARAIHRHGQPNLGGSLVLVSERKGALKGFLIGVLDAIYPAAKELLATDLLFIIGEGAQPSDASRMLKALIEWAQKNPKVIELRLGVTDAMGDYERAAKLYERLGLARCGVMFNRSFER